MNIGISAGGIARKIYNIANCLETRGVEVLFYDPWKNQIPVVDVLHCFTTFGNMYYYVKEAVKYKKPVVISPVFAPYDMPLWKMRLLVRSALTIPGWLTEYRLLRKIFDNANAILPLHEQEKERIQACFGVPDLKLRIVPNGIDTSFAEADPSIFERTYGAKDFVLQVGSIDPNKNQLTAIKAVRRQPYEYVIIGNTRPGHERYEVKCRSEAGDNVIFTGHLGYNDPLLASAFAAAKVFVLPSFSEVMPQVLYQAMQSSCNIVLSKNIPVYRELKGNLFLFNPKSSKQLRKCISKAMDSPTDESLREFGLNMPTWGQVSDLILNFYRELKS